MVEYKMIFLRGRNNKKKLVPRGTLQPRASSLGKNQEPHPSVRAKSLIPP
jgi:hypothetical protein